MQTRGQVTRTNLYSVVLARAAGDHGSGPTVCPLNTKWRRCALQREAAKTHGHRGMEVSPRPNVPKRERKSGDSVTRDGEPRELRFRSGLHG